MSERLDEIKQHLAGTPTSPLFLLDACHSLVEEVERMRNLKGVLMELGNRLVVDHGWGPANPRWQLADAGNHTGLIAGLTQQINDSQEMREALTALGYEWPIVEEGE